MYRQAEFLFENSSPLAVSIVPYFRRTLSIVPARSVDQIETVRTLFLEYQKELGIDLCFQNFGDEVANLPGDYAYPDGDLKLAIVGADVAGCVALRRMGPETCEMKRLYVRAQFRGKGLGRKLANAIIRQARLIGYQRMWLDTLPGKMDRAISMYESLGFRQIPAYYNNPVVGAIFMELDLKVTARE